LKVKIAAQPVQIQTGSVQKYVGALDQMKSELVKLEQERTQLLQKYQPNSRFVRDNQKESLNFANRSRKRPITLRKNAHTL
jgi:hypothetical protein